MSISERIKRIWASVRPHNPAEAMLELGLVCTLVVLLGAGAVIILAAEENLPFPAAFSVNG